MKRICYILLLALVFFLKIVAQNYNVRVYDDSNGLSHNHVTRVLQDSNGFIWVATWNGLNRFNGVEFDTFKVEPGDGNNVTNDRIRDFYMDKDGTFLCLVHESIYRFDTRTCRFSAVSPQIQRKARKIMDDQRYSAYGKPHSVSIGNVSLDNVHHEMKDRQGNIWLVGNNGIYKVEKLQQPHTYVEEVPQQTVRCMYQDKQGRIWITTKNGGNGEVVLFDNKLNLLGYLGRDGELHKDHTPFADVYCILHDKNDQLWLGTKPDGIYRLKNFSADISPMKPIKKPRFAVEHLFPNSTFYDIKQDSHGNIWLGSFENGICCMVTPTSTVMRNSMQIFGKTDPKECKSIRRIVFKNDTLIASTTVGLLIAYPKGMGEWYTQLHGREANRKESLSCSATMDVLFDAKDHLVVTTESGGINILQTPSLASSKLDFMHITHNEGLGCDISNSACMVSGDLLLQNNTEIVKFTANDYRHPICFGRTFWNGHFHFSDTKPLVLDDGRLLLSLENGAITIPLKHLTDKTFVPHLALTCISMPDGTRIYGADAIDTLRLTPDQRDVTIKYATLDYCANGNIRYATRFDDTGEWSIHSTTHDITLYDLTSGTHTLEIRSTNAAGIWTDNIRRITFIVEPHFSETLIAKLLLLFLFAAIITAITYTFIYIRNIKRQRQETLEAYLALIETKNASASNDSTSSGTPPVEDYSEMPKITPEDKAFMERFMAYVEQNISNSDANLDEMAEFTATSRSSLNRKTKSLLGVTPADFLKEARLKHAAQLLRTTEESTSQIAYMCGFSDPKYFAKCFKSSYGVSPKDYTKE